MVRLIVLFLSLGSLSCSGSIAQEPPISFEGRIDKASVDTFLTAHADAPRGSNLVIKSAGGDAMEAIRLGRFVREKDFDIEVDGFCISACAQYVLPAASTKIISDQAVVAFHSSPSAAHHIFESSGLLEAEQVFRNASLQSEGYLAEMGIDPAGLLKAAELMQPVCLFVDPRKPSGSPEKYGVAWQKSALVVTVQQLRELGYTDISGRDPERETLGPILRSLGFNERFNPAYYPDASLLGEEPEFDELDEC